MPGWSSCGCMMDMLQKLYKSSMRPFRDRPDILVPGRWYWCPPGAKAIPYLHAFGSHRWDSWERVDESPVGERRQRDGFNNKVTPTRYTGQNWCGTQDVWENGLIYAAGGTTPVDSEGYPLCCLTTAPQNGGAMAEGVADYIGPDDFAVGGVGLGGDVAEVLDGGVGLGGDVAEVLDGGVGLGGDLLEMEGGMGLGGEMIDVLESGLGLGSDLIDLLEGGVGLGGSFADLEGGIGLGSDLIDLIEGGVGLGSDLIDLIEGGIGLSETCYSHSLALSGSAYVDVPSGIAAVYDASADFSIAVWTWWSSVADNWIVGHDEASGNDQVKWIFGRGVQTSGHLQFHINSPGSGPGLNPLSFAWDPVPQQWHHLAVVCEGSDYTLYIDGLAVQTTSEATPRVHPASGFTIGTAEGAGFFQGQLADVRLYAEALTPDDVADLAGCEEPVTEPVAQWLLGEGLGTVALDAIGELDASLESGAGWACGRPCDE